MLVSACSSDDETASEGSTAVAPIQRVPVDPLTSGSIEGIVRHSGEVPEKTQVKMGYACAKHRDGPAFYALVVARDGLLQNAFVTISQGLEGVEFAEPVGEVEIDQRGCIYEPRISAARTGQDVTFINSDSTNHNVHTVSRANRGMNFSMPSRNMRTTKSFKKPEIMVRIKCDVHPWMGGWIGVQRHPHMAVTGADGAFRFDGVPPGSYTVTAWHETLGRQDFEVQLQARGTARAEFQFEGK